MAVAYRFFTEYLIHFVYYQTYLDCGWERISPCLGNTGISEPLRGWSSHAILKAVQPTRIFKFMIHSQTSEKITYSSQLQLLMHRATRNESQLLHIITPNITRNISNSSIICDITLCSPLKMKWCFGGTHRLQVQDRIVSQGRNQYKVGRKSFQACFTVCSSVHKRWL
jgi:hypothetical protein